MFPFNRQFKIQMKSAFRFEKKRYQVTRWIIHQRLVDIQIPRFGRWPISIIYIKRDTETQVTRVTPLLSLVSINNVFQWKYGILYRFNCIFSIRLFHPRRHSIVVSIQETKFKVLLMSRLNEARWATAFVGPSFARSNLRTFLWPPPFERNEEGRDDPIEGDNATWKKKGEQRETKDDELQMSNE